MTSSKGKKWSTDTMWIPTELGPGSARVITVRSPLGFGAFRVIAKAGVDAPEGFMRRLYEAVGKEEWLKPFVAHDHETSSECVLLADAIRVHWSGLPGRIPALLRGVVLGTTSSDLMLYFLEFGVMRQRTHTGLSRSLILAGSHLVSRAQEIEGRPFEPLPRQPVDGSYRTNVVTGWFAPDAPIVLYEISELGGSPSEAHAVLLFHGVDNQLRQVVAEEAASKSRARGRKCRVTTLKEILGGDKRLLRFRMNTNHERQGQLVGVATALFGDREHLQALLARHCMVEMAEALENLGIGGPLM